jgi:FixJ family two-component response regulator
MVVFMGLVGKITRVGKISNSKSTRSSCDHGPTKPAEAGKTQDSALVRSHRKGHFHYCFPHNPMVSNQSSMNAASPTRLVCVIDDEAAVRQSLWRVFRSAGQPVVTFSSADEFLTQEPHPGPCCLVLDVRMPGLDGFGLQQRLMDRSEQIVFLSGHGDVPMCARAFKSGAVDFLTKPVDDEVLLAAAARALDRSDAILKTRGLSETARQKLTRLTQREAAVMERVVAGMLNKQIAAELGIAEKTIKVHRGRMMRKAGVVSVPELVKLAIAAGRIEDPAGTPVS